MELDIPEVIGPNTLENFFELCQKLKIDLSEDGVNQFKDSALFSTLVHQLLRIQPYDNFLIKESIKQPLMNLIDG